MRKIKYINPLGEELQFAASAPFILQNFDESQGVDNYKFKGVGQDGETYLGNTLDSKDVDLTVAIIAKTVLEYNQYKEKLYRVFNPKLGQGYIVYDDGAKERKIKCIPEKVPFLKNMTQTAGSVLVNLTAHEPFWKDLQESRDEIAMWVGDFEFDLEIPEDTGIDIGHREPSLIVNCINDGDVETGIRIDFKALATLVNPSLFNVNTREFIKIKKTLAAGEVISVSTYFGDKRIISRLNGVETNAFYAIDEDSTFLQLDKGDNLFRYDADSGIDNLEVTIYHYNNYLGV